MLSKVETIQKVLKKKKLDLALITSTPNIRYILNKYDMQYGGIICIPKDQQPFMISSAFESADVRDYGIDVFSVSNKVKADIKAKNKLEALKKILKEKKISTKKIGLELGFLNFLTYDKIRKKIRSSYNDISEELLNIRAIKSKQEISILKKGARITVRGMKAVRESLTPNMTEKEIAGIFEAEVRKHADWYSFDTIVASGKNSSKPHHQITERKILAKDLIVIDCGIIYKNMHTDMTRTFCLKPGEKEKILHKIVLEAQKVAINKLKTGIKASIIDKAARDYMKKLNHNQYFTHGLGHGVGMDIHEKPSLDPDSKDILKENMIFTIEPGAYIPEFGGVRIEDMVLLTKKGKQILTKFTRRL
ncbi:MAG: aminopeptidase P family protein [Candidatus Aenigmarchaeota archaeon]|nr:aminopeptidase P family protein [Candidatus Aenigmarchaeota archaeon]